MKNDVDLVERFEADMVEKAKSLVDHNNLEEAMAIVSSLCWMEYEINRMYSSDTFEEIVYDISQKIANDSYDYCPQLNTVVFYDGFGHNTRGLALIYLKALAKRYRVIYITEKRFIGRIDKIKSLVNQYNGVVVGIDNYTRLDMIRQLDLIVSEYSPKYFFTYTQPDDVVIAVFMDIINSDVKRIQINLTDQAFWLGKNMFDLCIEFRDYGAIISKDYRKINKDKIVKLPYYPFIDENISFLGTPYNNRDDAKVIFSGGSLFKTISDDDRYFKVVNTLLSKYPDIIFWYAGDGCGFEYKLTELKEKYKDRVYFTNEREDLIKVLEHSFVFLNTYPIAGGLMMQFAAKAHRIPLTLRFDDESEGVLINQEKLEIMFDSEENLYKEFDRLYRDVEYKKVKENRVYNSVISEKDFENNLYYIMENSQSQYVIDYKKIDTTAFRNQSIMKFKANNLYNYLVRHDNRCLFKVFPFLFTKGLILKNANRVRNKVKKICRL